MSGIFRCDFELDYRLRSTVKRPFGKRGTVREQLQKFEVPVRSVVTIDVVHRDPITGKRAVKEVSKVMGYAKEHRIRRLVGETWKETTEWIPVTRPMEIDSETWSRRQKRSEDGYVRTFLLRLLSQLMMSVGSSP